MVAISVDAGTTNVKVVAYDDSGCETCVSRQNAAVTRPKPGWAEQDMTAVWEAVCAGLRECIAAIGPDVDFIATTGQGDGVWLVDANHQPVRHSVLWNDGRSADIVDTWRGATIDRIYSLSGSMPFAGNAAAILTWLQANEPESINAAKAVLTCNGWIHCQLTGEAAVDVSDASVPFLDLQSGEWSDALIEAYQMPWVRDLLPSLRGPGSRVREVSDDVADRVGLRRGTPVVMAPYDVAATAAGCGMTSPESACVILGTTISTQITSSSVEIAKTPIGSTTLRTGIDDLFLRLFPTAAGGDALVQAAGLFGLPSVSDVVQLADQASPGAEGLTFFPYVSPAGERAPFLDPLARGGLLGLSLDHDRATVARAILEGLTHLVQDCLDAAATPVARLGVAGGGASPIWLQLIADLTGLPVYVTEDDKRGSRGAFLAGLVETGAEASYHDAAKRHVTERDPVEPTPEATELYAAVRTKRVALRDAYLEHGSTLASIRRTVERPR